MCLGAGRRGSCRLSIAVVLGGWGLLILFLSSSVFLCQVFAEIQDQDPDVFAKGSSSLQALSSQMEIIWLTTEMSPVNSSPVAFIWAVCDATVSDTWFCSSKHSWLPGTRGLGLQEGYPVQAACAEAGSQGKGEGSVEPALASPVLSVLVVAGGWWTLEEVRLEPKDLRGFSHVGNFHYIVLVETVECFFSFS